MMRGGAEGDNGRPLRAYRFIQAGLIGRGGMYGGYDFD